MIRRLFEPEGIHPASLAVGKPPRDYTGVSTSNANMHVSTTLKALLTSNDDRPPELDSGALVASNRAMLRRALSMTAALTSSVILAACGHSDNAPAAYKVTKESLSSTTTTPTTPLMSVDAFPDISSYNDVPFDVYEVIDSPRVQGFAFTTPDGLQCANNAYPTPEFEWVSCWGPRPDRGPGLWSVNADRGAPATIEPVAREDVDPPWSTPPPLLPPLTRISAQKGNSTCGVGEHGLTACRVGDHGFVLTPTSTTLF